MQFTTESFDLADRKLKSYTLQPRGFLLQPFFLGRLLFRPHNPEEKWKQKYNITDVNEAIGTIILLQFQVATESFLRLWSISVLPAKDLIER